MRQPETTTINGRRYTFRPLPPTKAIPIAAKLGAILGPVVGAVMKDKDVSLANLGDVDIGVLGEALGIMCERIDGKVMAALLELGAQTEVEVAPGVSPQLDGQRFDDFFDSNMGDFAMWLMFVFKAQFADFFQSWVRAMPKRVPDVAAAPSMATAAA